MFSQLVPGPLVRWFARPYVAGDSVQSGLEAAALLRRQGLRATLDLLGEGVTRTQQVEQNVNVYCELIDCIAGDARFGDPETRPSISLKPSAFTTDVIEDVRGPITEIAERADAAGVALTIDMEERRWTDFTIDLSVGLFERGFDVGTVLQTRLNRTEADLARIPKGMRLRLVIGIYPEPADVAVQVKGIMKNRMLEQAKILLERGVQVEFATHDEAYIERFAREIAPAAPNRSEVQMLLGVPRKDTHKSLMEGVWGTALPVRIYLPFAVGWDDATAYLRRRMEESPSMILLVLRNLLRTWQR